ncbi:MAG: PLP-dependent aminotransferase family protein [Myxococcales bacterium]|nr:PLP-dependent aminotransferase family protein [Myxococcales bacterium]MCB9716056.1 PLP-dependent aminotransferase family protein [Myxococcales bacterium]
MALELQAEDEGALTVRIAGALREEILRGRLRAGQRLPGSRTLARQLGVNRNTITAAYDALDAEGWIRTEAARGRWVSAPEEGARPPRRDDGPRAAMPGRLGFGLGDEPITSHPVVPSATFDLSGGLPDVRLVPWTLLARAYRRALERRAARLLDYGPVEGLPELREQLATMLADARGLACSADDVFVTRGSQMALWLVGAAVLRPGDRVAVEAYGYRPAWDALRAHGAELVPVPVDDDGLDVARLAELARRSELRAVYLTPHHQYPTTVTLSGPRRLALLDVARAHRLAIVEDDYDHEFHYEGRPVLPLATLDRGGHVIYVGTLSKVLAPGLRLGYVVAPAPLLRRLAVLRSTLDRQGDLAVEAAVAELMEDGEVQRHAWRARRSYLARRDALVEELGSRLGDRLVLRPPSGGLALWAQALELDVDQWVEQAAALGVRIRPARQFAFDGRRRPFVRMGFARHDEGELRRAARRLATAASRVPSSRGEALSDRASSDR